MKLVGISHLLPFLFCLVQASVQIVVDGDAVLSVPKTVTWKRTDTNDIEQFTLRVEVAQGSPEGWPFLIDAQGQGTGSVQIVFNVTGNNDHQVVALGQQNQAIALSNTFSVLNSSSISTTTTTTGTTSNSVSSSSTTTTSSISSSTIGTTSISSATSTSTAGTSSDTIGTTLDSSVTPTSTAAPSATKSPLPAAIGGAIGGVAALAIIVALIFCYRSKRRKHYRYQKPSPYNLSDHSETGRSSILVGAVPPAHSTSAFDIPSFSTRREKPVHSRNQSGASHMVSSSGLQSSSRAPTETATHELAVLKRDVEAAESQRLQALLENERLRAENELLMAQTQPPSYSTG